MSNSVSTLFMAARAGHQLAAAVVQQAGAIVAQIPKLTVNAALSVEVDASGVADVAVH